MSGKEARRIKAADLVAEDAEGVRLMEPGCQLSARGRMGLPMRKPSAHRRAGLAVVAGAMAISLATMAPMPALARDVVLGVHYTSEEDMTDTIYASEDGETFWAIARPYVDRSPGSAAAMAYDTTCGVHNCHMDPSITYWNGRFWMMSAMQRNDGRFWPVVSYSDDLVHWTHPEGDALLTADSTRGVKLDELPTVDGRPCRDFDVVTPKFAVIDGQLYVTFCAGRFGLFHGNPGNDQMTAYVMRVDDLSAEEATERSGSHLWPKGQRFVGETAHKVAATEDGDFIDSNLVESEDGSVWLAVKKGGLTEQLLLSSCPADPARGDSYALYDPDVSWGYEGVSINRVNGAWHLFGDGVAGTRPRGMRGVTTDTLARTDRWSDARSTESDELHALTFLGPDRRPTTAMHGQEITISETSEAYATVKGLLDSARR